MSEEWRDIKGFKGSYAVSNQGNVKSLKRVIFRANGKKQLVEEKIMKPARNSHGYFIISLSKEGKGFTRQLHRLAAKAFLPLDNTRINVNHKNGIKTDNRVENLEWMTQKENIAHALRLGLIKRNRCDLCGMFRKKKDLVEMQAEGDETWTECRYCCCLADYERYFKAKQENKE